MEKKALSLAHDEIVRDLQPQYVIKDLVDWGVIASEEKEKILAEDTEESQAELLLRVVEAGGSNAFQLFAKSLYAEGKYDWLADLLLSKRKEIHEKSNHFKNILTRGGVPHLPPYVLLRHDLQEEIIKLLSEIHQNPDSGWVVIHGMAGSGKSLLAAAVVRESFCACDMFPQGIFWIKIGNPVSEDGLLSKMHMLCEKLDPSFRGNVPCSLEMASDRLRVLFTNGAYHQTLLIVDDVWEDWVIRHLDFGCCILCTTRDKSIVDVSSRNKFYVHLKDGFTLEESRTFFADSLKIQVSELPKNVDRIWKETQGFPLVIAIVSAIVRRHPSNFDGSFKTCLQKLKDNSLINVKNKHPYEYPCIRQALQMSVESLQELQDYYWDLAIFPNDFFIYGQVLAILWDFDMFEVEEIMNSFIDKSVAIQVSNGHISNSYNIHDLFLNFMKNTEGNNIVERHERLLKRYLEKYGGKYENLPNDGYILQYLGHHLYGAKMFDSFPEVFLNFKVIIAKLLASGPADLLGDFRRYKIHITQNGKYTKELKDVEEFVRSNAHLLTNACYDILQVAMLQPSSSIVFHKAKEICKEKSSSVYFEWTNRDSLKNAAVLCTRLQQQSIFCAVFSCDGRHIISGGDDNVIKIITSDTGREVVRLEGHSGIITWLANYLDHNSHKQIIVSSSTDCTVRVWHVFSRDLKNNKKVSKIDTCSVIFKNHTAKVKFCCILKNGMQAASIDKNGEIKIWDPHSGSELASWRAHSETNDSLCCDLSQNGIVVVSAAATFLRLWNVNKKLPIWEHEERHDSFSSCLFTPEEKEILASFSYKVGIFSVENGVQLYTLMDPKRRSLLHCTISEDGAFIAASSMMQSIMVWKRESREIIDYNHGHKGWVYSVSFSPMHKDHTAECHNALNGFEFRLASAGDDGTVIIWKTSSASEKLETILREVYFVQFDEYNEPFIVAVDMNNKIKVYDGKQQLLFTENGSVAPTFRIQCLAVSHKKDKVLYGSTSGFLKLFDIRSGTSRSLSRSKYSVCCCLFTSNDKVMIAGFSDGNIVIFQTDIILTESHSAGVTFLKLFNDDRELISCSLDNTMKVWHVTTGFLKYTCIGHEDTVVSCDITSDGKLIASSSADKTLKLWNAAMGMCLAQLTGHSDCVRVCKFAPGGNLLVSGDDNGTLKLWSINKAALLDVESDRIMQANNAELNSVVIGRGNSWIHDVDFSSDGSRLVVCSEDIQWWSTSEIINKGLDLKALQIIPIRGSKVSSIYCSKNFESFVCVDDTGVLYHLKLFTHDIKES